MSYGTSINPISLQERYKRSNPFINATNPLQTTHYEPTGTTETVDYNVKYNAPQANNKLAYAGFYSNLYGQPNYTAQKLDLFS